MKKNPSLSSHKCIISQPQQFPVAVGIPIPSNQYHQFTCMYLQYNFMTISSTYGIQ